MTQLGQKLEICYPRKNCSQRRPIKILQCLFWIVHWAWAEAELFKKKKRNSIFFNSISGDSERFFIFLSGNSLCIWT